MSITSLGTRKLENIKMLNLGVSTFNLNIFLIVMIVLHLLAGSNDQYIRLNLVIVVSFVWNSAISIAKYLRLYDLYCKNTVQNLHYKYLAQTIIRLILLLLKKYLKTWYTVPKMLLVIYFIWQNYNTLFETHLIYYFCNKTQIMSSSRSS